jgi:hypothetical protein
MLRAFFVHPPAPVPVPIRQMVMRVIRGKLLRPRHGVPWTGGFRDLLMQLIDEILLDCGRPFIEPIGKIVCYTITKFLGHSSPYVIFNRIQWKCLLQPLKNGSATTRRMNDTGIRSRVCTPSATYSTSSPITPATIAALGAALRL